LGADCSRLPPCNYSGRGRGLLLSLRAPCACAERGELAAPAGAMRIKLLLSFQNIERHAAEMPHSSSVPRDGPRELR
jgi:hypothetical protein